MKEVYEISDTTLNFFFPDNISVFGKIVPNDIPRKGETLCKTATYWFNRVEEKLGIDTHFIGMVEDNILSVQKIKGIIDKKKVDDNTTNYLIPLEFISRYFVAGSLYDRIARGDIDYNMLGFDVKPSLGEPLPKPFFEVHSKLEENEKILNKKQALKHSGLNDEEFQQLKKKVLSIDELIKNDVEKNGLIYVDGRKEFAIDKDRDIILVDTFGTADEDRFWEKDEYEKGNMVQKTKESVRKYYKDIGYQEKFMEARKNNDEEPSIPPLTDDLVEEISEAYVDMMKRLTDGKYT